MNQSYVIGTSTKVDISGVNLDKFDDKYFAKEAQKKKKKGEGEFFEAEKEVSLAVSPASCHLFIQLVSFSDPVFLLPNAGEKCAPTGEER